MKSLRGGPHSSIQRGLTLVEMMVALVISVVLMAGVVSIFSSSKKSNKLTDSLSFMQESGRMAINVVTSDLRRAGYYGGNKDVDSMRDGPVDPVTPIAGNFNTCSALDNSWGLMLKQRVFGLNGVRTGYDCIPASGANAYGFLGANGITINSDVIAVRYADPQDATAAQMAANPTLLYIRSSLAVSSIFFGADQAANPVVNAQHPIVTYPLVATAYYIGTSAVACNGEAVPALFQVTTGANGLPQAREIVAGIEDLQVQYGWDTDGDIESIANRYVSANTLSDLDFSYWTYAGVPAANTVSSVRVWILARAACADPTYSNKTAYEYGDKIDALAYEPDDNYRRQLYSATITLRN